VELLGVLTLAVLALGLALTAVGFALAGNIGISPVLAYSAGMAAESGLVQPATRRRIFGARLRLVGFALVLASIIALGILANGASPDDPPGFP
jgi:hypothetical protein